MIDVCEGYKVLCEAVLEICAVLGNLRLSCSQFTAPYKGEDIVITMDNMT